MELPALQFSCLRTAAIYNNQLTSDSIEGEVKVEVRGGNTERGQWSGPHVFYHFKGTLPVSRREYEIAESMPMLCPFILVDKEALYAMIKERVTKAITYLESPTNEKPAN